MCCIWKRIVIAGSLSFTLFTAGLGCNPLWSSKDDVDPDATKVLFIGSSYLSFNNLPRLFRRLAEDADKKVHIETRIIDGKYLDFHASSLETRKKIGEQDWDYVVMQGGCHNIAYPEGHKEFASRWGIHPVFPAMALLNGHVKSNCRNSKSVYFMPQAFEDGMTWIEGQNDHYDDMQLKIRQNSLNMLDDIDIIIAPVGMAWYRVLMESHPPLHYLHLSDWNHPSVRGSYLAACVIYVTLFQESVLGNPYRAGVPQDEVDYFQEVASATVLDSLALWNIQPIQ